MMQRALRSGLAFPAAHRARFGSRRSAHYGGRVNVYDGAGAKRLSFALRLVSDVCNAS